MADKRIYYSVYDCIDDTPVSGTVYDSEAEAYKEKKELDGQMPSFVANEYKVVELSTHKELGRHAIKYLGKIMMKNILNEELVTQLAKLERTLLRITLS